jgi:hypothetical protein
MVESAQVVAVKGGLLRPVAERVPRAAAALLQQAEDIQGRLRRVADRLDAVAVELAYRLVRNDQAIAKPCEDRQEILGLASIVDCRRRQRALSVWTSA